MTQPAPQSKRDLAREIILRAMSDGTTADTVDFKMADEAVLKIENIFGAANDAAIRNATLDAMVAYHKDMIVRLHKPKNGAVSIASIRSAVIQHEKSIATIESLRTNQETRP